MWPTSNCVREIQNDFQNSPDVLKDHWSNMAAMQNNLYSKK